MKYRLNDSLGTDDARTCNIKFGADLPLDEPHKLAKGVEITLPKPAADFLAAKYPGLISPTDIHAVPQAAIHGTPEKATEDLRRYKEKGTVKE